jgi:uncharacterized protein YbdZ (MbtH family)
MLLPRLSMSLSLERETESVCQHQERAETTMSVDCERLWMFLCFLDSLSSLVISASSSVTNIGHRHTIGPHFNELPSGWFRARPGKRKVCCQFQESLTRRTAMMCLHRKRPLGYESAVPHLRFLERRELAPREPRRNRKYGC